MLLANDTTPLLADLEKMADWIHEMRVGLESAAAASKLDEAVGHLLAATFAIEDAIRWEGTPE
jgi:hypothetical protein